MKIARSRSTTSFGTLSLSTPIGAAAATCSASDFASDTSSSRRSFASGASTSTSTPILPLKCTYEPTTPLAASRRVALRTDTASPVLLATPFTYSSTVCPPCAAIVESSSELTSVTDDVASA